MRAPGGSGAASPRNGETEHTPAVGIVPNLPPSARPRAVGASHRARAISRVRGAQKQRGGGLEGPPPHSYEHALAIGATCPAWGAPAALHPGPWGHRAWRWGPRERPEPWGP